MNTQCLPLSSLCVAAGVAIRSYVAILLAVCEQAAV